MDNHCLSNQTYGEAYLKVENALTLRLHDLLKYRVEVNRMADGLLSLIHCKPNETDGKQGVFLPTDFKSESAWYDSTEEFRRSFKEETKRDLCDLFRGKPFDVWMIREVALIFLKSFQNNKACFVEVKTKKETEEETEVYNWLRDCDVVRLANLATAMYLEAWLERDSKSYQTPYGFLAHPYKVEDRYRRGTDTPDDNQKSKMQRAFHHQEMLLKLRKQQIEQEGTSLMSETYTGDDFGHPIDLISLAWCDAYVDGRLDILKYLFEKKYVMTRAEDKRSEKEYGLASACRDYQAYLAEIHNIETHEHAPIENHRRFVASSMMFHRLERAYCFHIQGRIAERICNESVDLKKHSAEASNVIMRRYSGVYDYLFVPSWAAGKDFKKMVKEWENRSKTKRTKRPRVISNERMDVLDIDFYINHMFCVDGAKISYVESILHWHRRCMAQDLLTFLFTLYPPSEQHSWLEEDFRKASVFYREYYPITEEFLKVKFPAVQRKKRTKDKDFYCFFVVHILNLR